MDAGRLQWRVVFKRPQKSDDGFTSGTVAFQHHCNRWAAYKATNGREVFENQGREAQAGASFWVRSDSQTREIDETFRLTFEDRDYDIAFINPIDRDYIEIIAVKSDRNEG